MASIRITNFKGLLTERNIKSLPHDHAQIAHNCLLWDGWLHPMPKWTFYSSSSSNVRSLYKSAGSTNGIAVDTMYYNTTSNPQEPFVYSQNVGIGANGRLQITSSDFFNIPYNLGLPIPPISNVVQSVTNNNQSIYPISRTYAITLVSYNAEGPPFVLPQLGVNGQLIYEGDTVSISFSFSLAILATYLVTGFRLYRTVPGFDTSEQLGNPLETSFHLVKSYDFLAPNVYLVDYGGTPNSPFDTLSVQDGSLLISDQWMPPDYSRNAVTKFFGQTESGWFVNAKWLNGESGTTGIDISERYMAFAWPPQNNLYIPENITGMATFYDTVFVGTGGQPYRIHIGIGEGDALDIKTLPYIDQYPCVYNTMVSTNFGAMYVTNDGIISLSPESGAVSTKRVANPGDKLITPTGFLNFYSAASAGWFNGNYFGFCNSQAFIFNQPTSSTQDFERWQLTTMDTPTGICTSALGVGSGFYGAWGNTVYSLPLPGYGYDTAAKLTYTWKSSRFVMDGLTTFAAMKVVNDNSGTLQVTLNGYNSGGEGTPEFTYTRPLNHSNPFRIPHQHKCLEWEIQLVGTSVVQEVHLATSERDLVERQTRFDEYQKIN